MKKLYAFFAASMLLFGCAQDQPADNPVTEKKSNFEVFEIYGQVHNELLRHVADNFVPTRSFGSRAEVVDHVLAIQQRGVDALEIPDDCKLMLQEGLESYKDFYIQENVLDLVLSSDRRGEGAESRGEAGESEISRLVCEAFEAGRIDYFEYVTFNQLIDCVVANVNGQIGTEEILDKVHVLIGQWENNYSDVDYSLLEPTLPASASEAPLPSGSLGGVVLSISKSSMEYWKDEWLPETKAIPPPVAMDIAGAVLEAAVATVDQFISKDDSAGERCLDSLNTRSSALEIDDLTGNTVSVAADSVGATAQSTPEGWFDWELWLWRVGSRAVVSSTGIIPKLGTVIASF